MPRGLYVIETRELVELDSPVISSIQDVAEEEITYGYLSSPSAVFMLLERLHHEHMHANPTLQVDTPVHHEVGLVGQQPHSFAHQVDVTYGTGASELPQDAISDEASLSCLERLVVTRNRSGKLPFHMVWNETGLNFGRVGLLREWGEQEKYRERPDLRANYEQALLDISALLTIARAEHLGDALMRVFPSPTAAVNWLSEPLEILGRKRPSDQLVTNYARVEEMLETLRNGVSP